MITASSTGITPAGIRIMMLVFNILRHNPGRFHHCHHCLSFSSGAGWSANPAATRSGTPSDRLEHWTQVDTVFTGFTSVMETWILRVLCGGRMSTWHFFSIWVEVATTVTLSAGGGSSCTGGGTSGSSWWADTVHSPSFFVSTSWKTWRSIYRKIYIINKIVTDIHS